MLDAAVIVRISNLLPNLFYMDNYDRLLRTQLANALLLRRQPQQRSSDMDEHVYILSVQEAQASRVAAGVQRRYRRSLDRAVDVLVAVYNPIERRFVPPKSVLQTVNSMRDQLSARFGGQVDALDDICTHQVSRGWE